MGQLSLTRLDLKWRPIAADRQMQLQNRGMKHVTIDVFRNKWTEEFPNKNGPDWK